MRMPVPVGLGYRLCEAIPIIRQCPFAVGLVQAEPGIVTEGGSPL